MVELTPGQIKYQTAGGGLVPVPVFERPAGRQQCARLRGRGLGVPGEQIFGRAFQRLAERRIGGSAFRISARQ